ncbi:DNA helicase INO80 [Clarias magur]|uniref:DNA helicase INO80 n=1 Tax=Clarias magur TaxID=1594786 RepID=A0A8J4WS10_CLAMG|nr:DNA helicase INO80 [Clarias magur]
MAGINSDRTPSSSPSSPSLPPSAPPSSPPFLLSLFTSSSSSLITSFTAAIPSYFSSGCSFITSSSSSSSPNFPSYPAPSSPLHLSHSGPPSPPISLLALPSFPPLPPSSPPLLLFSCFRTFLPSSTSLSFVTFFSSLILSILSYQLLFLLHHFTTPFIASSSAHPHLSRGTDRLAVCLDPVSLCQSMKNHTESNLIGSYQERLGLETQRKFRSHATSRLRMNQQGVGVKPERAPSPRR